MPWYRVHGAFFLNCLGSYETHHISAVSLFEVFYMHLNHTE